MVLPDITSKTSGFAAAIGNASNGAGVADQPTPRMNPFNKAWIFLTWMLVATALGGTYFADDRNIAPVALVLVALLLTAETIGVDRAERDEEVDRG